MSPRPLLFAFLSMVAEPPYDNRAKILLRPEKIKAARIILLL